MLVTALLQKFKRKPFMFVQLGSMTQHSLDKTSVISSPSKRYPLKQMFRLEFKSEAALHLELKWPQMNWTAQNARQLCIKQKQAYYFLIFLKPIQLRSSSCEHTPAIDWVPLFTDTFIKTQFSFHISYPICFTSWGLKKRQAVLLTHNISAPPEAVKIQRM